MNPLGARATDFAPDTGLTIVDPAPAAEPDDHARSRNGARRRLLAEPIIRRLLVAQTAGQTADAMTTLALTQVVVFDLEQGASPTALARALIATTVPILVAGPLAGIAADRWHRRRTLVFSSVVRAMLTLAACAVPITRSPLVGYALAAALMTAARVLYSTRIASVPHLVQPRDLVTADSLGLISGTLAGALGSGVGIALATISPISVLTAATVLHVVAAVGFRRLPELGGHSVVADSRSTARIMWRRTFRLLRSEPVRFAIGTTAVHRFLLGGAFATFVLLAGDRYELESSGYAVALGIMASGGFVGTVVAPSTARRLGRRAIAAAAYTLAGSALVLAGCFPSSMVVLVAMMVGAFAFQNLRLVTDALVQAEVADDSLGRVFAVYDIANHLAFASGALIVIGLADGRTVSMFLAIGAVMTAIGIARYLLTIVAARNLAATGRIP